ncbi:TPA: hypothetical protein VB894_000237 [Streptococcus suis]|nr:hypothetical protein [Streptococcus suis]
MNRKTVILFLKFLPNQDCPRFRVFRLGLEAGQKAQHHFLEVRVNISAQWLIGGFVRVLHSKSDHYD